MKKIHGTFSEEEKDRLSEQGVVAAPALRTYSDLPQGDQAGAAGRAVDDMRFIPEPTRSERIAACAGVAGCAVCRRGRASFCPTGRSGPRSSDYCAAGLGSGPETLRMGACGANLCDDCSHTDNSGSRSGPAAHGPGE